MRSKSKRTHNINQSPFFRLNSKKKLAEILHIDRDKIKKFSKGQDEDLYREWDEPKPSGKVRHIENPRYALKQVQARIAALLSRITPPDYLYCPAKGRSYVSNAHRHVNGSVVRSLDIKNYFRSTTKNRVSWFFHQRMECSQDVACILTDITTFKEWLPTGSPHSSILSYFAHEDMWQEINKLAEQAECIISIYIDDITISGKCVSDSLIWEIRKTIRKYGLRYHKEKYYRDEKKEITGVILRGRKILVPNRQHLKMHMTRQQIRAEADPELRQKLVGRLKGLQAQAKQITSLNADYAGSSDGLPVRRCRMPGDRGCTIIPNYDKFSQVPSKTRIEFSYVFLLGKLSDQSNHLDFRAPRETFHLGACVGQRV